MEHRKDNHSAGFTLVELLLTLFILMLVTTIVATGIPVAKDAYDKVVVAANAEAALSTAMSTLRNELGTAQNVAASGKTITYYNTTRGAISTIEVENDKAMITRYADYAEDAELGLSDKGTTDATPLLSEKAATQNLCLTYSGVSCENGIVTFTDLAVYRPGSDTPLAGPVTFSVRVISEAGK